LADCFSARENGLHGADDPVKTKKLIALSEGAALAVLSTQAQTFQNLNFESATVAASGPEGYPNFVPIGSALPGWTAYLGTQQVTEVGYNAPANSVASITVIGPTWNSMDYGNLGVLDGNYSVDLQTGSNPFYPTPETLNASIEQNGTVPSFAQSIQFEAFELTPLSVSFNGNALVPVALSSGVSAAGIYYTLYGANLSAWAGQTGELEFTAVFKAYNYDLLDDISFSPTAVTPEPSIVVLTAIGGLLFGVRKWFGRGNE
jgi:hypothetical protein